MAQDNIMKRQVTIINYLRNNGKTFDEIAFYLELESEIQGADLYISRRTLQRDIINIRRLYGIEIKFNRTTKCYDIIEQTIDNKSERLMEAFDLYNTLTIAGNSSKYIQMEKRKSGRVHFIMDIVTAIKNRRKIKIQHKKYWEQDFKPYILEPLMVKEYRYRWYLIAKDINANQIKSFGLDRILIIEQTNKRYEYPVGFDAETFLIIVTW